jgi:uncharacterized protein YbjT (DUF2867 family)
MKIVVLGATGATGKLVVEQALAAGHEVTALVRSPQKVTTQHPSLTVIAGQATSPSDVTDAILGADAVISVLGAAKGTVMTDATVAMVAAAREHSVPRIVMLSSFAAARDRLTPVTKGLTGLTMKAMLKDKATAEQILRASDLNWTILYAARLTNGPATGSATLVPYGTRVSMSQKISRADVASWLLAAAALDSPHDRQEVVLVG